MQTSRVTEMPQKQSTRGQPHPRASSLNSDHRANQKKLGTRIADLECNLGQAQEELKSLKDQLSLGGAFQKATQKQVEKKSKTQQVVHELLDSQETNDDKDNISACETSNENQQETDVFKVSVESVTTNELDSKLSHKDDELELLKAKLEEKEKEVELFRQENESLKNQLSEKLIEISSVASKGEEITSRLNQVEQELERSKSNAMQLNEKLEAAENAKEELESEMKKLQVITEQWRKAADVAASILAGDVETNGTRIFKPEDLDSQVLIDDQDDVFGGGKRRSSGIRIGDLWKKKGQK